MTINFIPNDPLAGPSAPQMRVQDPRPDRPMGRAGFTLVNPAAEGTFQPATPEFLFWQCREAALAAVEAWEGFAGNLTAWSVEAANQKTLPLLQDAGEDLNAFYDRASFSFFHSTQGDENFLGGQSTDVVAHEVGHGLLDSVRPQLFDTPFLEAGAFHEGFADCMALMTAFNDQETRQKVLAVSPDLGTANFLEATAEDLSEGIRRRFGPDFTASAPRHALNTFGFQIPSTLPSDGPPNVLINEVHSFGQLLSGSFYDTVRNVFNASPARGEAELRTAAQTAARLLVTAVASAPIVPRFIQSVGRSMILSDQQLNASANRDSIRAAFEGHGIALGANAMLAPTAVLAGPAAKGAVLGTETRKDLLRRIGAPVGAKLVLTAIDMFGARLAQAVHEREVSLGSLHKKLSGVVAKVSEPVILGATGKRAAVMGAMPEAFTTQDEVLTFVQSLIKHDRISFDVKLAAAKGPWAHTHRIRKVGGKKVLTRVCFNCARG